MTTISEWKRGFSHKNMDVQAVKREIDELPAKTPAQIVAKAKGRNSAMHDHFEWDDSQAAHEHRLSQARQLVQNIVVRTVNEKTIGRPVREYISVKTVDEKREYKQIGVVLDDDYMRHQALADAKDSLRRWRERYEDLHELAELFGAIDIALAAE